MPGDYSRFTDDARKRFSRVLMQQGRVQLDSDWNELVEIFTRRDRTQVLDIIGPAAVPRATTPDAFKISVTGADLAFGAGRMYVDGVLAEALADDQELLYSNQPFWPDPTPLGSLSGDGLVYLDVWDREVTSIEDRDLLEPALGGIDTTTRTQTIWQVRVLTGDDIRCDIEFDDLHSDARLSVQVQPPSEVDPCLPPESGGVEDVENRFYRVEVHESSPAVKFKFYRAPVITRVEAINGAKVTVERIGLDSVLRFLPGQWVELTNDRRYLNGEPGLMAKIVKIDEAKREIELDRTIAASETSAEFPARLIRWDQQEDVDADGLLTATGAFQPLERGIEVKLSVAAGGSAKVGDYWNFPSRVAGRTAGPLTDAAPKPEHHYASLATIDGLGGTITVTNDCRNLWPEPGGDDCECTVCVSPNGPMTIQQAIELAKSRGGGKVCLRPGVYFVRETIRIEDALSLSLTGHGVAVLLFAGTGPVILVESSTDIVIEQLGIVRGSSQRDDDDDEAGVLIRNCLADVTVQRCAIAIVGALQERSRGVGILLDGLVSLVQVRDNMIFAPRGVSNDITVQQETERVVAINLVPNRLDVVIDLEIRNNLFFCTRGAVMLMVAGISANIEQNYVLALGDYAILIFGLTIPAGAVVIDGNNIATTGGGIAFTTSSTQVTNNTIAGPAPPNPEDDSAEGASNIGIAVASFLDAPARDSSIIGNRLRNLQGNAIALAGAIEDVLIKQNAIRQVGGGGIVFAPESTGTRISIDNNDLVDVAVRPATDGMMARQPVGIALPPFGDAQVSHNSIRGLGMDEANGIVGLLPARLRVIGNSIEVDTPSARGAGIALVTLGALVEIEGNMITGNTTEAGAWSAIRVLSAEFGDFFNELGVADLAAMVITGNTCRNLGRSREPVVSVVSNENVTFADNYCGMDNRDEQPRPEAIALIQGRTAIVTSNRVPGFARTALQIRATQAQRWTVLGNIADFGITVDGATLTAPWLQLNRT